MDVKSVDMLIRERWQVYDAQKVYRQKDKQIRFERTMHWLCPQLYSRDKFKRFLESVLRSMTHEELQLFVRDHRSDTYYHTNDYGDQKIFLAIMTYAKNRLRLTA